MKSLNEIDRNFTNKFNNIYILEAQRNPSKESSLFERFINDSSIGINRLAENKISDLSTASDKIHHYILNRNDPEYAVQNIDDQYIASYNTALFLSLLDDGYLRNLEYNRKIKDVFQKYKDKTDTKIGTIITDVINTLRDKDKAYTTYENVYKTLREAVFTYYFYKVSKDDPHNAINAFNKLLDELGINKILELDIKQQISKNPILLDILKDKYNADSKVNLLISSNSEMGMVNFMILYRTIQRTGSFIKNNLTYRLPRPLMTNQRAVVPSDLMNSNLKFGDVVNVWIDSINEFMYDKSSNLSVVSKSLVLTGLIGVGYLVIKYNKK